LTEICFLFRETEGKTMGRKAGQKTGAPAATDDPAQSLSPAKKTKTAKVRTVDSPAVLRIRAPVPF
jgi:hypothetical protein